MLKIKRDDEVIILAGKDKGKRGKVRKVFDYVFAGATGALKLAMDMPVSHWNQLAEQTRQPAAA